MRSHEESLTALIVEDDADSQANLCDILELDHWRVETATTARAVLNRTDWSDISIVILDRKLPDGNAEQLLPEIKRRAPQASVIVATGYADLDDAILALRHGAADYLIKPINPDALRASMSRIVEQKQTELALRETQQRLQHERDFAESLIQTAQMIVLLLDVEGQIVRFNPYLEEVSGYRLQEVQGADWFENFLPKHDSDRIRELFRNMTVDDRIDGYVIPILTRQGIKRDIRWSVKALKDGGGLVLGILMCGQDITDLKQAQERALQSERLAAIGQMMAGLAHESRNALQRSKACLEMLAMEVEDRPSALDLVARTQRAQDDLQTLYEEVRQYAAPIKLNREPSDLADLWRVTWAELTSMHADKDIRLREDLDKIDLVCNVDRFSIGQVWRNILENAIQVSAEHARITIQCAESTIDGGAAVRIRLIDEGPGMTADQRERVFEPFFTTKTKGTGLGMAIAQRIVSSHGGRISVADREGPGAEIVVILPRGAL